MKTKKNIAFTDEIKKRQPTVLFDGDCALCTKSVQFLLRHNKSENLTFASLQSGFGKEILSISGFSTSGQDTLLFVQGNEVFSHSTAALKISAHLRFPWFLVEYLLIIPPFIRDFLYRFIARNRYRWFGKRSVCLTGVKNQKSRFLS
ncbi:DUF393 domain-containing protein [bacterium]|jgi:predicted DCC family thiol-disulfide oxidoreductase YuxK|nr:DUF393 domain-containing protein [bacterium]